VRTPVATWLSKNGDGPAAGRPPGEATASGRRRSRKAGCGPLRPTLLTRVIAGVGCSAYPQSGDFARCLNVTRRPLYRTPAQRTTGSRKQAGALRRYQARRRDTRARRAPTHQPPLCTSRTSCTAGVCEDLRRAATNDFERYAGSLARKDVLARYAFPYLIPPNELAYADDHQHQYERRRHALRAAVARQTRTVRPVRASTQPSPPEPATAIGRGRSSSLTGGSETMLEPCGATELVSVGAAAPS
jgi:hypothetical protein